MADEKKFTEKTFEQLKTEGTAHLETLRQWGDNRCEEEQIIYAHGYQGNLVATAICGDRIRILSLMYDLLEEIAKKSDVDFITMVMGFLHIYNEESKEDKKEDNSKDKSE